MSWCPSRPDAPLAHEAFFWETLKCSGSVAPVRTRAQLRQPVVSSRVQQAAFQTGWNAHLIPQSCHRNSAVVGTTHLPQELVLVGLSDDACYCKSSLSGEILKRTLRVHAHVPAGRFRVPFLRLFISCLCVFVPVSGYFRVSWNIVWRYELTGHFIRYT